MSFSLGYLAPKQLIIWGLRREGISQAEIGRRLGVRRQVIHEQVHYIDAKVGRALMEAAQSNRLDVRRIDTVNGILEAYSNAYDVSVIVSFSKTNGIQVWYLYEGRCERCNRVSVCRQMLTAEARERGLELTDADLQLSPTQLGRRVFSPFTTMLKK